MPVAVPEDDAVPVLVAVADELVDAVNDTVKVAVLVSGKLMAGVAADDAVEVCEESEETVAVEDSTLLLVAVAEFVDVAIEVDEGVMLPLTLASPVAVASADFAEVTVALAAGVPLDVKVDPAVKDTVPREDAELDTLGETLASPLVVSVALSVLLSVDKAVHVALAVSVPPAVCELAADRLEVKV